MPLPGYPKVVKHGLEPWLAENLWCRMCQAPSVFKADFGPADTNHFYCETCLPAELREILEELDARH